MKVKLVLFKDWNIRFEKPYQVNANPINQVEYITKNEILEVILYDQKIKVTPKKGRLKV